MEDYNLLQKNLSSLKAEMAALRAEEKALEEELEIGSESRDMFDKWSGMQLVSSSYDPEIIIQFKPMRREEVFGVSSLGLKKADQYYQVTCCDMPYSLGLVPKRIKEAKLFSFDDLRVEILGFLGEVRLFFLRKQQFEVLMTTTQHKLQVYPSINTKAITIEINVYDSSAESDLSQVFCLLNYDSENYLPKHVNFDFKGGDESARCAMKQQLEVLKELPLKEALDAAFLETSLSSKESIITVASDLQNQSKELEVNNSRNPHSLTSSGNSNACETSPKNLKCASLPSNGGSSSSHVLLPKNSKAVAAVMSPPVNSNNSSVTSQICDTFNRQNQMWDVRDVKKDGNENESGGGNSVMKNDVPTPGNFNNTSGSPLISDPTNSCNQGGQKNDGEMCNRNRKVNVKVEGGLQIDVPTSGKVTGNRWILHQTTLYKQAEEEQNYGRMSNWNGGRNVMGQDNCGMSFGLPTPGSFNNSSETSWTFNQPVVHQNYRGMYNRRGNENVTRGWNLETRNNAQQGWGFVDARHRPYERRGSPIIRRDEMRNFRGRRGRNDQFRNNRCGQEPPARGQMQRGRQSW